MVNHKRRKKVFRYGTNSVGDPQLWSFISDHTPVAHVTPDQDTTHYKQHGVTESGVAYWTQPYVKEDSYNAKDVVFHIQDFYMSLIPFNVWEPEGPGVPEGLWYKLPQNYKPGDELPPVPGETEPEEPEIPEEPVEKNSNGTDRWSEWINPVGYESQGVYGEGDGVTYQGARKISNYDNNGSLPSDPGWWRDA